MKASFWRSTALATGVAAMLVLSSTPAQAVNLPRRISVAGTALCAGRVHGVYLATKACTTVTLTAPGYSRTLKPNPYQLDLGKFEFTGVPAPAEYSGDTVTWHLTADLVAGIDDARHCLHDELVNGWNTLGPRYEIGWGQGPWWWWGFCDSP
jgi:hypothetical protein